MLIVPLLVYLVDTLMKSLEWTEMDLFILSTTLCHMTPHKLSTDPHPPLLVNTVIE